MRWAPRRAPGVISELPRTSCTPTDKEQHRDDEDDVRDYPVAILGGHAAGVQEQRSVREERQEQGAERGVDDHQRYRLSEGGSIGGR